ncbi:FAD:protein FMN transferase [Cecembia rubra]|uniref:FAD:protein FMN transferase n=1 Tax=Cecembia rubra TaxID=1485585 RepID=A0A2P8EE11_9BACT|nr:FAD:protein FMN transferase [Cecembia rubra]PSL07720.1 thiamine biosynthesis lipoprotein ApbE [Cecembia rubra]
MRTVSVKNLTWGTLLILTALVVWLHFFKDKSPNVFIEGKALGVFYSISFEGDPQLEKSIDSLIHEIDLAVNLQLPNSEISRFNRFGSIENTSSHLSTLLELSNFFHFLSGGAVSHTMLPLIKEWGREFSNQRQMTNEKVEELVRLCDIRNVEIGTNMIKSNQPGIMLDLNYLDKGYLIDQLSDFLMKNNVKNFHIEFGLDGVTYGLGKRKNSLNFLNNLPPEFMKKYSKKLNHSFNNTAYSSSGNLNKFYVDAKGNKHSHLIDLRTGFPISNGILATHITSSRCVKADAFATICMILDLEDSIHLINNDPDLEGLIVYNLNGNLEIWNSSGFKNPKEK